ncbi:MAG TPA: hypothetical protein VGG11_03585 [Xanthobacteraceae bacterium]|jgi:hypothetical protein
MKKSISRSVFVALIAGCTAASGMAISAPLERATAFDGNWSVVIHTRQGDCGESLRYAVRIAGGQVQSLEQNYRAAGAVSPNGAIRVMVAEGDRSASGAGRLKGNVGSGLWRTDRGDCSGDWTAQRRGDNW